MFPDIWEKRVRRPQLEDGGDVPQLRMVAHIPNKRSRAVNDEVLSLGGWRKWYGLFTVQLQRVKNVTQGRELSTLEANYSQGRWRDLSKTVMGVYKMGRNWPSTSKWILTWGFRSSAFALNSRELIPIVSKEFTAFIFSGSVRSFKTSGFDNLLVSKNPGYLKVFEV